MATEIKSWQIINGKPEMIETTLADNGKTESLDLESWIESNPEIVGSGVEIIGRQVMTKSGPLDLLGIDQSGNIIVIELKRDKLPREALAQAIDYASDVADWSIDKLSEICTKQTGMSLEDLFGEKFSDVDLENLKINETQRIILIGFGIESSLERMINWLSDSYGVNLNAIILKYTKTSSGDELLTKTAIISEELEKARANRRKFSIPMSDDPGNYSNEALKNELIKYLSKDMASIKRIRNVLLPVCLEIEKITREQLKQELVNCGEAETLSKAGYLLSIISQQVGMVKNDFLRQVIGYGYPTQPWEKDNYHIREGYEELVREVLDEFQEKG